MNILVSTCSLLSYVADCIYKMFYILICLLFGLLQYNPYLYMCWMPRTGLSFKLLQKETFKVDAGNCHHLCVPLLGHQDAPADAHLTWREPERQKLVQTWAQTGPNNFTSMESMERLGPNWAKTVPRQCPNKSISVEPVGGRVAWNQ